MKYKVVNQSSKMVGGLAVRVTHKRPATNHHLSTGDVDHKTLDTLVPSANISHLISEIREQHKMRVDFHRAEKRLTLQMRSVCRRLVGNFGDDAKGLAEQKKQADKLYDAVHGKGEHEKQEQATGYLMPLMGAREVLKKERKRPENLMQKLAKQLPVWSWVDTVHGFGALGLAQIIGEAGDLNNYANPGKLWKRMGLAVINGGAQRKVTGVDALEHGYNPERRAIMFCIGDSLLKKQNFYRELYLSRKIQEEVKKPADDGGWKMLWHKRAQRYAEKRLLRDLWKVWRNEVITKE